MPSIMNCWVSVGSSSLISWPKRLKKPTTLSKTGFLSLNSTRAGHSNFHTRQNSAGDFMMPSTSKCAWAVSAWKARAHMGCGTWVRHSSIKETTTSLRGSKDFITWSFSCSTPATMGRITSTTGLPVPIKPMEGVVGPTSVAFPVDLRWLIEVVFRLFCMACTCCACTLSCATFRVRLRALTSGMSRGTASPRSATAFGTERSTNLCCRAAWKI
mmetsp:Transcript_95198/g.226659  ORF Transcript_95198/g.226659 Transcript_95198/m.226659 type:complete len:214 (-) Transcript_95198:560-1201(-)